MAASTEKRKETQSCRSDRHDIRRRRLQDLYPKEPRPPSIPGREDSLPKKTLVVTIGPSVAAKTAECIHLHSWKGGFMSIIVTCPKCSKKLNAPDSAAGSKGACKICGTTVMVPLAGTAPDPRQPEDPLAQLTRAVSTAAASPASPRIPEAIGGVPQNAQSNAPAVAMAAAYQHPASGVPFNSAARTRTASGSMSAAFRILLCNPANGVSQAYDTLGPAKAFQVGVIAAVVFDIAVFISAFLVLDKMIGLANLMAGSGSPYGYPSSYHSPSMPTIPFTVYLKLVVVAFTPLASIALALLCARKAGKGKGCWQGDVFVAGISLIPFAVVFLAAPILGPANIEAVGIMMLVALCLLVLTLFHGFKDLAGLSPGFATLAVPATLLLSSYLAKIMIAALV